MRVVIPSPQTDPTLLDLIAKARAYVDQLSPAERREMLRGQAEGWARAELSVDEGTRTGVV